MKSSQDNYNFSVKETQPDNQTQQGSNKANKTIIIASSVVGGLVLIVIIVLIVIFRKGDN